jgi:hypothetical protein
LSIPEHRGGHAALEGDHQQAAYSFRVYSIVKSNQKPYIDTGIFLDYVKTVFLQYLVRLRGLAGFAEAAAVH